MPDNLVQDMNNRVCILIPTYNGEKYLNFAVASVLSQTFKKWQMIIADDGSQDQTINIAKGYAEQDSRISVSLNPKNMGLYGSINHSLKNIENEFIVILMQDDLLLPLHLESFVNLADRLNDSQTYWSASQNIDAFGTMVQDGLDTNRVEEISPGIEPWQHILQAGCIWIISGAFSRTEYMKRELFRSELSHAADWEWILRLVRKERCIYFEKKLVQIRLHIEQASASNFLLSRDLQQYRTVVSENIRNHGADISMMQRLKITSAKRVMVLRRVVRHTIDRRWRSALIALKLLLS